MRTALVATLCLLGAMSAAHAQEGDGPPLDIGWLLFGDIYFVPGFHTEEGEGAAGLVVRRGYLTLDADFSDNWFGRARAELNQSGEFETYDFEVDFKDLHVGWNLGRHRLVAGLVPTLTYDLIESIWGFRHLARTPMDLQGVPSRDTGLALKGPLNATGSLGYRAMIGTELEFGADSSDSNKYMAAVSWKPTGQWTIDFYADWEELGEQGDRTTSQVFVGYQADRTRWGAQYSHQDREDDPKLELASAFVTHRLGEETTLIGRIDRLMEPSPKGDDIDYLPFDPSARATLFMAALAYQATASVSIIPNVVYIPYDRNDEGARPNSDLHLRLTLFLDFE